MLENGIRSYIMIKIERTSVMNFDNAIRGARNPMNSWVFSDSYYDDAGKFVLGEADLTLAKKLAKAGSDHRKFMRQIFVSVDITAPLYWWKEFDTYKVGTVANSCSTMHKIHSKEFTKDDFSHDKLNAYGETVLAGVIDALNHFRIEFNSLGSKGDWYNMIQLLPSSYNQLRTVTLNYENLVNIYKARHAHKLHEWHVLCDWIKLLPYSEIITGDC